MIGRLLKRSALVVGTAIAGPVALAIGLPKPFARWLGKKTGGVLFWVPTNQQIVALTIDDAPSDRTGQILEVLDRYRVKATFFIIGEAAEKHPENLRAIAAAGHELGNHFYRDEPSILLSDTDFDEHLRKTARLLEPYAPTRYVRPGSGWVSRRMVRRAAFLGYRMVLGSVYPLDPIIPFPNLTARIVRMRVREGAVIILHDGSDRGPRTARALESILPHVLNRGYEVAPLSRVEQLGEWRVR